MIEIKLTQPATRQRQRSLQINQPTFPALKTGSPFLQFLGISSQGEGHVGIDPERSACGRAVAGDFVACARRAELASPKVLHAGLGQFKELAEGVVVLDARLRSVLIEIKFGRIPRLGISPEGFKDMEYREALGKSPERKPTGNQSGVAQGLIGPGDQAIVQCQQALLRSYQILDIDEADEDRAQMWIIRFDKTPTGVAPRQALYYLDSMDILDKTLHGVELRKDRAPRGSLVRQLEGVVEGVLGKRQARKWR